ncbi:MAG: hypothetical protein J0I20_34065 [Chloroflexi bacterium]|nr:hypothetical protein [Chloroflexota bacterium]OJW05580.1 MAG: hypothetical protein BGO39_02895 [Chloroflexi bacterium 54-19]
MTVEIYRNSVTAADQPDSPLFGPNGFNSLFQFTLPAPEPGSIYNALPELPVYGLRERDYVLSRTVLYEGNWAGAISIAITKMASLGFNVKAPTDLAARKYQELFHASNVGQGWVHFLSQHLRDFLNTDNGAFIEVVRATPAVGSKIIGLVHLDSKRCYRTGDPEIPVLYRDRKDRYHQLRAHQVITFVDMPTPEETFNGIGLCAASRAYKAIRKMAFVDQYLEEKVSGFKANSIHFLTGINDKQLKKALDGQEAEQRKSGAVVYRGAAFVPMIDKEGISHVEVELAGLPDGFDYEVELSKTHLKYANAIGLDIQDLEPLSGQALGTGAQSMVLNNKAKGKGLAAWLQQFTHLINFFLLPNNASFFFAEKSLDDELKTAQVTQARAAAVLTMVQAGVLDPATGQPLQYMVDLGELPQSYLPVDTTPQTTLSDTDKIIDAPGMVDLNMGTQPDNTLDTSLPPDQSQPTGAV